MDKIRALLKDNNVKVTPQRIYVYAVLAEAKGHLSVQEVHSAVQKNVPAISLATVYSILEYFRDIGLIRDVKIGTDRSFYEARRDGHHHFLCRVCKTIQDIDIHPCPTLVQCEVEGNVIEDFQGYFYGTCKKCK